MATDEIPVVDFSALSLENKDPFSEISTDIEELADQVYQAFSTIGFVYLKNHGIPQEVVSELSFLRGGERDVTNQNLPHEKKNLRLYATLRCGQIVPRVYALYHLSVLMRLRLIIFENDFLLHS